jgi:hypothetical protein
MALPFYIYNKQKYGDICQRQTNKCHSAKSRAAAEEFKLLCKSNTPLHCEITTVTGQIVIKETMIPNNGTIEFSKTNLTKGLYNLKIIDDKETVVLKIIIN